MADGSGPIDRANRARPLVADHGRPIGDRSRRTINAIRRSELKMRILVVEDEEKVASFIRKGLEQMSYTVDVVHNGEDALASAAVNDYAVIVLDIMLPGRDGLSV